MAIAYSTIKKRPDIGQVVVEITLDGSYSAGGYALDNAQLGMMFKPDAIDMEMATAQGFLPVWDQVNHKLKVFEVGAAGAFDEADSADLSTSNKVRCVVTGTPRL